MITLLLFGLLQVTSLPDRSAAVKDLVLGKYASLLDGTDDKGRIVTQLICNDLNLLDNGKWAMLLKIDRDPPFVPYDILVWTPTMEHVDILSARSPMWIPYGSIPPQWTFKSCNVDIPPPPPTPIPVPTPTPTPIFDFAALQAQVNGLENQLFIVSTKLEVIGTTTESTNKEVKEHRIGVQRAWLKVSAIAAPIVTGITVWLKMKASS